MQHLLLCCGHRLHVHLHYVLTLYVLSYLQFIVLYHMYIPCSVSNHFSESNGMLVKLELQSYVKRLSRCGNMIFFPYAYYLSIPHVHVQSELSYT